MNVSCRQERYFVHVFPDSLVKKYMADLKVDANTKEKLEAKRKKCKRSI